MNARPDANQGYVVLTGYVEPEDHLFVSIARTGRSQLRRHGGEALDNLGDALAVHLEA